ncbi:MAG TPA: glycosyltransferase family 2 protein [Candidatus Saccharimonadales bacterium]|jgi:hypothetical protein
MNKSIQSPVVVIPNINGGDGLLRAVDSLVLQTTPLHIIIVDNASTDDSIQNLLKKFPLIEIIKHSNNKGYAGGVNPGFKRALELGASYTAPFNNDAVADPRWLERLVTFLDSHQDYGAAASKVQDIKKNKLDSSGEFYSVWGLPYPRGRSNSNISRYDMDTEIFAASGAASLYRTKTIADVGLLDEDFFAYYEDVDLGFRMQLMGWKVGYVPQSVVYHATGSTSSRIHGFTTLQTLKNQPLVLWKNVPTKYLWSVSWRFIIAHNLIFLRAIFSGNIKAACTGYFKAAWLILRKTSQRKSIQKRKRVSDDYIWSIMTHDLPPNATALRRLRSFWWRLIGRQHNDQDVGTSKGSGL